MWLSLDVWQVGDPRDQSRKRIRLRREGKRIFTVADTERPFSSSRVICPRTKHPAVRGSLVFKIRPPRPYEVRPRIEYGREVLNRYVPAPSVHQNPAPLR